MLRPAPAAVLLIRRGRPPALGAWSLPGGAQHVGETAEQAARRELQEETGLLVGTLHLAGYADSIHRDADGRVRFHYTILDFCAAWNSGDPVAGDDAQDVAWVRLDRLNASGLSDDAIRIIGLSQAIMRTAQ